MSDWNGKMTAQEIAPSVSNLSTEVGAYCGKEVY